MIEAVTCGTPVIAFNRGSVREIVDGAVWWAMQQEGGSGMTTSAAEEESFILSEEIIGHINSFFPPPYNHHDKANQACRALQALIYVIGIIVCEIDCPDCWELTIKAVQGSFAQMLTDLPAVRAEVEGQQKSEYVH